jgi:hypothetical protein
MKARECGNFLELLYLDIYLQDFSQHCTASGQKLEPETPKYEAGMMPIQLHCLVS